MRRIGIAMLALIVPVSVLRSDDPKKRMPPADELTKIEQEFDRELRQVLAALDAAQGEARDKLREQAFQLAPVYAKKVMALVDSHPADPAAVRGLIWVATLSQRTHLPPPPQAQAALDRLTRDFLASPEIAELCPLLETSPDGEKVLRAMRDKNPSPRVKALVALSLGSLLCDEDRKPTAQQLHDAERWLALGLEEAKAFKDLPANRLREAQGNLFEIRHLSVGKRAPEVQCSDLDGKKVKLSDLKGKVVVLDFWTTYCVPCRQMIPRERQLVKRLAGKPFALVSISGDAEKETLVKFLQKEPMPWIHWWSGDRGGILDEWNIKVFPTIYVIDAKGTIRFKNIHDKELDDAVESLVKEAEEANK